MGSASTGRDGVRAKDISHHAPHKLSNVQQRFGTVSDSGELYEWMQEPRQPRSKTSKRFIAISCIEGVTRPEHLSGARSFKGLGCSPAL